jgi:cobalt-zinc-cadmium efflux system protein
MQGHHTHHAPKSAAHDHAAPTDHAGHHHGPANYDSIFAIGVGLNVTYALLEAIAGIWLGSLALVADAGHNLSDVLGLLLAWFAVWLSRRRPSQRHTYGLGRSSILAALINAVLLYAAVGAMLWAAVGRLSSPNVVDIPANPVMLIAGIGIVINAATAWLFMRGSKTDVNIRGAYLHMLADAAVSAGVVVSALLMRETGLKWIDPVTSIIIAIVIAWSTWGLLKTSFRLSLDAVPEHIDPEAVAAFFTSDPRVAELHDLHIWALSTEAVALTAHVVCPTGHPGDAWLAQLCEHLHEKFDIDHATIQVEVGAMAHGNHHAAFAPTL